MKNVSIILFILYFYSLSSQSPIVFLDEHGVWRYSKDKKEASFFGVNYTVPFAHAYRAHEYLQVNHEQAIKNDVYHLARLGLNAFRVHVWDVEISDTLGNLLNNEHLRLFDFLLAELKKRNIYTIITPIAYWGNGYPERDEKTPGFATKYGKGQSNVHPDAIKAQENYLHQFFEHINPYTNLSYKNDPHIIATEINNEPSHSGSKTFITEYINRMYDAIKNTGWSKPIYYNISQNPYYSDAVANSKAQGFAFQWYPSGLVGNRTIKGNYLPHVNTYNIPFRDTIPAFANKALMVYEFDPADLFDSYMYPAMAKAFRSAGFQWATQFAYDPLAMAYANTEYQTHYVNLAYTPAKAIGLMIAKEVFLHVARYKTYGGYPTDSLFEDFRLSYSKSLAEMNTDEKFLYTNTTTSFPKNRHKLKHIAGVGTSPMISYDGTGVYFLDKLETGIWRLEVMPDVIQIRDPFEKASLDKIVGSIHWQKNKIKISLDDLGKKFSIIGLNDHNMVNIVTADDQFMVSPGTYVLTKKGKSYDKRKYRLSNIELNEFVAPKDINENKIVIRHEPITNAVANKAIRIKAIVAGLDTGSVTLYLSTRGGSNKNIKMIKSAVYTYEAEIPADYCTVGIIHYRIIANENDQWAVYPGAHQTNPFAWDYTYQTDFYSIIINDSGDPISIYNPTVDKNALVSYPFKRGNQSTMLPIRSSTELRLNITATLSPNEVIGVQNYIRPYIINRISSYDSINNVMIKIYSEEKAMGKITLVDMQGNAFSSTIDIKTGLNDIRIPLEKFDTHDSFLLLPRPYPGFQPIWFKSSVVNPGLNLKEVERIEFNTGTYLKSEITKYNIDLYSISLTK